MADSQKTCILVSTCDRYREFATFTSSVIDQYWDGHPPIFFCGATSEEQENWLPLRDNPKDWVSITKHAIEELEELGFYQCYLILDDHPPVGSCNSIHLNQTLPRMMDELEAATICLNGWGRWRPGPEGELLSHDYYCIERMAENHPWKFQLHPALWNLDALRKLLNILLVSAPEARRTPWNFERNLGNLNDQLPDSLKRRSYRVNGREMSASRSGVIRDVIEKNTFKTVRGLMGKMFGDKMWNRINTSWEFLYRYYEGPYPLIWSGILSAGKANEAYLSWLKLHRRTDLLSQVTPILQRWSERNV